MLKISKNFRNLDLGKEFFYFISNKIYKYFRGLSLSILVAN